MNGEEKLLGEIESAIPVKTEMLKKVKRPYCWNGGNFSDLDRSNQPQHSFRPKPGSEQGPNSQFYLTKAARGEEAVEEKLEVSRSWLTRFKGEKCCLYKSAG